jgi:hypothetical protein
MQKVPLNGKLFLFLLYFFSTGTIMAVKKFLRAMPISSLTDYN